MRVFIQGRRSLTPAGSSLRVWHRHLLTEWEMSLSSLSTSTHNYTHVFQGARLIYVSSQAQNKSCDGKRVTAVYHPY